MSFLDELATRLVSNGIGVLGTTLFIGSSSIIPAGDGPYTTISETGGTRPTRKQNQTAAATQQPTAQIAVRAKSPVIARAKAKAAYNALDGVFNTTISGTFFLSITARQEPTDAGRDEAGRGIIVFNVDAEKQPS